MLLSEAAKTGRKFRRKSDLSTWYQLQGKEMVYWDAGSNGRGLWCKKEINAEMLIANDWETEPKRIEVGSEDLLAIAKILSTHPITNQRRLSPVEFMKLVIEELGLED